jgi:hypothetical protein
VTLCEKIVLMALAPSFRCEQPLHPPSGLKRAFFLFDTVDR